MADYELKVPAGTADTVRARLADASPDDLAPLNRYSVRKGDTLQTISRKLQVSRADLAEANYLSATARLAPGQQLIIPREPTRLLAARADNPVPATESRSLDAVVASRAVPSRVERTDEVKLVHRVKQGETLASIARLYRTSVASLKQWNRMRTNALSVGQRLTIFSTRQLVATN
jgi:membrane-bound lytic murein transglycosylase D